MQHPLPPARVLNESTGVLGFSLIETVVALGILAIALSCLLAALPPVFNCRAMVEQETRAGLIAENLLAEITAFGGLRQGGGTLFPLNPNNATYFISLKQNGDLIQVLDHSIFISGISNCDCLVSIRLDNATSGLTGLSTVEILVEWPGCVASHARKRRFYHSLILCPQNAHVQVSPWQRLLRPQRLLPCLPSSPALASNWSVTPPPRCRINWFPSTMHA